MKAVFIESFEFTEAVVDLLPNGLYANLQQELMDAPDKGTVVPGCGGLRKLRTPDPSRQKGKRSGARLIYLYVPEARWFYMLDLYDKDEKEDLSAEEKKLLKQLAEQLKIEAVKAARRRKDEET